MKPTFIFLFLFTFLFLGIAQQSPVPEGNKKEKTSQTAPSDNSKTDPQKIVITNPQPTQGWGSVHINEKLPPNKIVVGSGTFRAMNEQLITILILAFGIIILGIAAVIIYKHGRDIDYLFKYFIIILVIIGSIVLLSVGYEKDQIAPAIGLFGTIAGYLLGKSDNNRSTAADNPQERR